VKSERLERRIDERYGEKELEDTVDTLSSEGQLMAHIGTLPFGLYEQRLMENYSHRQPLPPRPEEDLRQLRLPQCFHQKVYVLTDQISNIYLEHDNSSPISFTPGRNPSLT